MMLAAFHGWACTGINCELGANVSCSDASMQSASGGGRGYAGCEFGFVIGIGIFKWSLSPSAPCHYCGSFNLCFGHFGRCRRERAGSCQSQKDKYACCKAILGVSLLSDPAERPLWSFNFLAGMSPAESAPKQKAPPVTFFKVPRVSSLFILLKQANARFSKTLQLPTWGGEICHQLKPRQSGLRLPSRCQGYLCFVSQ
jgi:hypothetical protein